MRRLKIFAKGNADVFDTLQVCRLGGKIVWNGVNEVLRQRGLGALVRMQHETSTGARGLDHPPAIDGPLTACPEALKPFPLPMQASRALFEADADAIVLSIQADVGMRHFRSVETGAHVYVAYPALLNPAAAAWLARTHVMSDLPDAAETSARLTGIIARIRERTQAPILIYNLSPLDPGPLVHCYLGLEDSFATRVRRFNLMLVELSQQTGVSIVDVESVIAKAGADRMKFDIGHFTGEGARLVAHEVVRVLEDYGLFDPEE
jgi:hypothetical protein